MQISLDVRNENLSEKRIHQICAWKPALCRFDERWSLARGHWRRRCGDLLARGSPVSPRFDCYLIVIFLGPVGDDSRSRQSPRTTQGCSRRLRHWRNEENRLSPRRSTALPTRSTALPTRKAQGLVAAAIVFRLLFTIRVVADRTCNYSPKLSAKDDRRSGAVAKRM